MCAFGKSFFRASRFNRIVCHFIVFANVFFPLHVNVDIFRNARCFQGFQRGAYRQLRVKEVSRDMIAVFRDSRDCLGYIPYNIALPVVRVYCDLVVGYNIGAGFIRAGFIARDKDERQKDCHCQNGKNKKGSFFVGFHNKPRKNLLQGIKKSKKYNKCIPADSATNQHTSTTKVMLCENAPVTEVIGFS